MASLHWRIGKVTGIENETKDTRRFWIEIPELLYFDFVPGQFVTLDLPIKAELKKRLRSYSIASWPNGTNIIELIVVYDKAGLGTSYLFDEIRIGAEILLRGPQGKFTLKEPLNKDVFFICTSTGIAPFRSMLHYIVNTRLAHQNIYLVFGCHTMSSRLYFNEMLYLQKKIPNFRYLTAISGEEINGITTTVHDIYEDVCNKKLPATFYVCGWKDMIAEAKARITKMGYDKKNIYIESYG